MENDDFSMNIDFNYNCTDGSTSTNKTLSVDMTKDNQHITHVLAYMQVFLREMGFVFDNDARLAIIEPSGIRWKSEQGILIANGFD